jgi:hypothetical protein
MGITLQLKNKLSWTTTKAQKKIVLKTKKSYHMNNTGKASCKSKKICINNRKINCKQMINLKLKESR